MATYLTHKMKDLTLFLLQEWNKEQNLQKNKVIIILIKQKKEKPDEYNLSSDNESLSESDRSESDDSDAFVISKKKKTKSQKHPKMSTGILLNRKRFTPAKPQSEDRHKLRGEVDELKTMIMELANLQKKQTKARENDRIRKVAELK